MIGDGKDNSTQLSARIKFTNNNINNFNNLVPLIEVFEKKIR